jgi:23S rRNA pseudouridine1911/1915/1917 synthase
MSMPINVLYEDNHIIAVEKPAGVLIDDLLETTKQFLKEKYAKPGNVFLGMVHQLDRPVSGIVLFGKTSKGAARLSEQFRDRETHKTYHAWVEGDVVIEKENRSRTLQNFLVKDENRRKSFVYDEEIRGSQYAELSYSIVEKKTTAAGMPITLLKIDLKTGRFHQIRAQLSHIGHPVLGDVKYGAKISLPESVIALTATSISFRTATAATPGNTEGEEKTLTLPVPALPHL